MVNNLNSVMRASSPDLPGVVQPSVQRTRNWINDPSIASRMPVLLCFFYCFVIFYLKAAAHFAFDIPHVDDKYVRDFIAQALWLISISLLPSIAIVLLAPVTKPSRVDNITKGQTRLIVRVAVGISLIVVAIVVAERGAEAVTDVYGNRLLVEHGVLAPVTILMTPFIFATVVVLALSPGRRTSLPVAILCLIWGVFLAKGAMLAYPIAIYVFIRFSSRRGFIVFGVASLVIGLALVVLLGRLRQGSNVDAVFNPDGLRLLLALFLARIDQLDSFALVLSQRHLEFSLSLWDEIVKSVLYVLPRGVYPEKPLSFSIETTKALRPMVFAGDAANNFTIFGQAFLIAGSLGPIICFLVFQLFFYVMALIQRIAFPTSVGFWTFNLSVTVPCFMSLVGAGLFREYVVLQFLFSLPGLIMFGYFFRRAGGKT
jgi:hypothetical protein